MAKDHVSLLNLVTSVLAIATMVVLMLQWQKLGDREKWMAEDYVSKHRASQDRLTHSAHEKQMRRFCEINGLTFVPADRFESPDFPKPPVSDAIWERINQELERD